VDALLTRVLDAHGGPANWSRVTIRPGRTPVLDVEPERITIRAVRGDVVEERSDPRSWITFSIDSVAVRRG
jgi:hypothetical protein